MIANAASYRSILALGNTVEVMMSRLSKNGGDYQTRWQCRQTLGKPCNANPGFINPCLVN